MNWHPLILAFFIAWILQGFLVYFQYRAFYRRLRELRRGGILSLGVAKPGFRSRVVVALVADATGTIVRAEKLAGLTVFARLQPIPELVGLPAGQLAVRELPGQLGVAVRQAASELEQALARNGGGAVQAGC